MSVALALGLTFGAVLAPAEATAEMRDVPLTWDAPEGCPSEEEVKEKVSERLDETAATDGRWAIARVRETDEGWNLRIWVPGEGAPRARSVDAGSCEELADAAVTLIAMTFMAPPPEEVEPEPEPDLDEIVDAQPEPVPQTEADRVVEPEPQPPSRQRPFHGAVRVDGALGFGALPAVGGGLAVTPALVWRNARLELRGTFWGRRTIQVESPRDGRALFRMASLALRGCGVGVEKIWEFPMCGGLETGVMFAQLDGVRLLHAPVRPWVAAHISAGVSIRPRPNVAITLSAEPWLALTKSRFNRLDSTFHESEWWGVRGFLGLELRFGGPR